MMPITTRSSTSVNPRLPGDEAVMQTSAKPTIRLDG
jgi:hypothetical protein